MVGTDSRTAKVSVVRRNLKEAAGKVLARRTGIAYEAGTSGREGKYLQSPITIQDGVSVDAAGIWDEGHANYPGRSVNLPCATGIERCRDGFSEVSRGHSSRPDQSIKG
jgi:hypothetical protein